MASSSKPASRRRGMAGAIDEYIHPARRRTDNPMVIGTIVICLGILVVTNIVNIAAVLWAGSQVRVSLDTSKTMALDADRFRKGFAKNIEAQAIVLRRLCLNTSKEERDRTECLTLAPPVAEGEKR